MSPKKAEALFIGVFTGVGIFFVIISIFLTIGNIKFKEVAVETTAEVTNVTKYDDKYKVEVSYRVDNEMFDGKYSTSSRVKEGDRVSIYYDKNNPIIMQTTTSNFLGIIFGAVGVISAFVGLGFLFYKVNKILSKKHLLSAGIRINTRILEVKINENYSMNGTFPYIIICEGIDDKGQKRTFKSENIWENPEGIIQERNITNLSVYLDKNNSEKYYVSLKEIEEKE